MVRKFSIVVLAFLVSGCVYNSRNTFAITGNGMNFSYGLISIKNADKIILLRETNMGQGEAKYNIPDMGQYMCPIVSEEAVIGQPAESRVKDIAEMNENKPPELTNP